MASGSKNRITTSSYSGFFDNDFDNGFDIFAAQLKPEYNLIFKKIAKKDSRTKLKGLEELFALFFSSEGSIDTPSKLQQEDVDRLIERWIMDFEKLALDSNINVRIEAVKLMGLFAKNYKKNIAKGLKIFFPYWLLLAYDTHSSVSAAGLRSIKLAIPESKYYTALKTCEKAILFFIESNFLEIQPNSDDPDSIERYIRINCASVYILIDLLNSSAVGEGNDQITEKTRDYLSQFEKFIMKRFSSNYPQIRESLFKFLLNLTKKSWVENNEYFNFSLNGISDSDENVSSLSWECLLSLLSSYPDRWLKELKRIPTAIKKALQVCRIRMKATLSSLLSLLSFLPDDILQIPDFFDSIFGELWKCASSNNANREVVVNYYFKCIFFYLDKDFEINEKHIVKKYIIPVISTYFTQEKEFLPKVFARFIFDLKNHGKIEGIIWEFVSSLIDPYFCIENDKSGLEFIKWKELLLRLLDIPEFDWHSNKYVQQYLGIDLIKKIPKIVQMNKVEYIKYLIAFKEFWIETISDDFFQFFSQIQGLSKELEEPFTELFWIAISNYSDSHRADKYWDVYLGFLLESDLLDKVESKIFSDSNPKKWYRDILEQYTLECASSLSELSKHNSFVSKAIYSESSRESFLNFETIEILQSIVISHIESISTLASNLDSNRIQGLEEHVQAIYGLIISLLKSDISSERKEELLLTLLRASITNEFLSISFRSILDLYSSKISVDAFRNEIFKGIENNCSITASITPITSLYISKFKTNVLKEDDKKLESVFSVDNQIFDLLGSPQFWQKLLISGLKEFEYDLLKSNPIEYVDTFLKSSKDHIFIMNWIHYIKNILKDYNYMIPGWTIASILILMELLGDISDPEDLILDDNFYSILTIDTDNTKKVILDGLDFLELGYISDFDEVVKGSIVTLFKRKFIEKIFCKVFETHPEFTAPLCRSIFVDKDKLILLPLTDITWISEIPQEVIKTIWNNNIGVLKDISIFNLENLTESLLFIILCNSSIPPNVLRPQVLSIFVKLAKFAFDQIYPNIKLFKKTDHCAETVYTESNFVPIETETEIAKNKTDILLFSDSKCLSSPSESSPDVDYASIDLIHANKFINVILHFTRICILPLESLEQFPESHYHFLINLCEKELIGNTLDNRYYGALMLFKDMSEVLEHTKDIKWTDFNNKIYPYIIENFSRKFKSQPPKCIRIALASLMRFSIQYKHLEISKETINNLHELFSCDIRSVQLSSFLAIINLNRNENPNQFSSFSQFGDDEKQLVSRLGRELELCDIESSSKFLSFILEWYYELERFDSSHGTLRKELYDWFKQNQNLITNMLKVILPYLTKIPVEISLPPSLCDYILSVLKSNSKSMTSVIVALLLSKTIKLFTTTFRNWWTSLSEINSKNSLKRLVEVVISPVLIKEEINLILEYNNNASSAIKSQFKISILKPLEICAIYVKDNLNIKVTLLIPSTYPMGTIQVDMAQMFISGALWRKWIFSMKNHLLSNDGSILDAILLWKSFLDDHFENIECCPVCIAIFHASNNSTPNLTCKTCKKKFHSICLYKWFRTANHSECPLCKTPFN